MAAISLSLPHGVEGTKPVDFTVGVLAPGAGDFEFRWNQTANVSGNAVSRLAAIKALDAFKRALESGTFVTSTPNL